MLEQDALEICQFLSERVRLGDFNASAPRLIGDPKIPASIRECSILVPVSGGRSARMLFRQLCGSIGVVGELTFPRERGHISCGLMTMQPQQVDMPASHGIVYCVAIGGAKHLEMPSVQLFSFDDFLLDSTTEASDAPKKDWDFGFKWQGEEDDEASEAEGEQRNPFLAEIKELVSLVVGACPELERRENLSVACWTAHNGEQSWRSHNVAILGFRSAIAANRTAQRIIAEVPRVNGASVLQLPAANIVYPDEWFGPYSLVVCENIAR